MRAKTAGILVLLLSFSLATASCNPLEGLISTVPPENGQSGGEQASPDTIAPTSILPGIPGGVDYGGPLKPIGFTNTGTTPATVMAASYVPLNTDTPVVPPFASTVVSPGGNSSAYLSLPLGTYTWCYQWEAGDLNQDGMMEYQHALIEQEVLLDLSDSDHVALAETVTIRAPADTGFAWGLCGLDITEYMVAGNHVDNARGALINMGHDGDSVTLGGPITISYWYIHAAQEIKEGVPREYTTPEQVVIPAGETWTFVLVDGRGEHPGDWNAYIWLVSVDE